MASGLWFITKLSATAFTPLQGMGAKLFDILGKNVRRVSNNIDHTILNHTMNYGWSEEMWSGNNYKNNTCRDKECFVFTNFFKATKGAW